VTLNTRLMNLCFVQGESRFSWNMPQ